MGVTPVRALSPRIVLYPAGSEHSQLEEGWIAFPHLEGGSAFGDGSHPTTRLCAGAVDLLCRQTKPQSFLDVGTGTGILARIARARGAEQIVGTDIDPVAIQSAIDHVALDFHAVEIKISGAPPDHLGPCFNLVVANILEGPLHELAPALFGALAPGGALLLSGFTRVQTPSLRAVFSNLGLAFVSESHLEEWALLMFQRPS